MMRPTMKFRAAFLAGIALVAIAASAAPAALARPGDWRAHGGPRTQPYAQHRQLPLYAQQRQMPPPGYGGRMNPDDRQKMREDMRWANREPQRDQPPGRMSPEEREKMRRDILDANRDMQRDTPRDRPRDMRNARRRW
jgi:hypothetical protein